jgi:hypothetical protein
MSAFQCSQRHVAAIEALVFHGPSDRDPAQWSFGRYGIVDLQAILWDENARSVAERYREPSPAPFPGRVKGERPTLVEGFKLLDCYEYQSCEHEGWDSSIARRICRDLRSRLTGALPGYDEAPWGLD